VLASATWDFVAFSEAVKCSPKVDRSAPSAAMFVRCPRRFAREELGLLDPVPVAAVVIGRRATWALAAAQDAKVEKHGGFLVWQVAGTRFFGVPHPASHGGGAHVLVREFAAVVADTGPGSGVPSST
jgi:hypothetical protein